jgi:hypothetical protein
MNEHAAYLDLLKKVLTASVYDESAWHRLEPDKAKGRSPLKRIRWVAMNRLIRVLRRRSILMVTPRAFDAARRTAGRDWPLFGYTMVGHRRLDNVQQCVEDVLRDRVPGDFIETGAWRGGVAIFMRALLKVHGVTDRKVWVADSFDGLPAPTDAQDGWDLSQIEYLKVSLERVRSNFEKFDLLDEQVEFLKGWFRDTLPSAPVESLAIFRLDGDLYSSTMDALTSLYDKVSRGGYIIVDDYYSWPSCRRAVTQFLAERSLAPEIKAIDEDGAYWRRT